MNNPNREDSAVPAFTMGHNAQYIREGEVLLVRFVDVFDVVIYPSGDHIVPVWSGLGGDAVPSASDEADEDDQVAPLWLLAPELATEPEDDQAVP